MLKVTSIGNLILSKGIETDSVGYFLHMVYNIFIQSIQNVPAEKFVL